MTLEYDSVGLLCCCEGSSMEISKHDSLIRLGRLNVTFQHLDSKCFSRTIYNLSRIARMTLARSTRLSFVRPYH